jgi:hypothetical protein
VTTDTKRWTSEQYAAWDDFNDARNDFMDATSTTALREAWAAGDPSKASRLLYGLTAAVREFERAIAAATVPTAPPVSPPQPSAGPGAPTDEESAK